MPRILPAATLLLALLAAPVTLAAPAADPHAQDGHAVEGAGHEEAGGSHGPPIIAKLVNSLIFFGLLGWFAGPWIAAHFRTRKAQIALELGAAQKAREEAEAKLSQMEARLGEIDAEVAAILQKAGAQAEAEKERIVASAKVEAARILEQAETQVEEAEAQASHRLRGEAADLAVELARGLVNRQLADKDRARLFEDYLDGLEKAAG